MKILNSKILIYLLLIIISSPGCKKDEPKIPTSVTDIDGNNYNVIRIGTQVWMKENLTTTKYNDGTAIPNLSSPAGAWNNAITAAYCDNNTPSNTTTYGRIYNWYTVDNNAATKMASNGGKNVCPTGWHVPKDEEWTILTEYLISHGYGYQGSGNYIGKSMASTSGWTTDPTAGNIGNDQASNNSSGFTALPSGYRFDYGAFYDNGYNAHWWSSSENSTTSGILRHIGCHTPNVHTYYYEKQFGFSVRCLKD